jgi:hypothetical protein
MRDLHTQYGDWEKAIAGYDGDTHVNADADKFGGDWKKGARPETTDYLSFLKSHGVDLDDQAANRAEASKHYKTAADADGGQASQGGYGFTLPRQAVQPAMTPLAVKVDVSSPAGSNTTVSVGGITQ